jgi:dTDP-4-dehydrorhamnose reductase
MGKISWFEFARRIVESANISVNIYPIKTYEYPAAAKRPEWSVMDLEKISQLPGIDIYDWKERLEHCLRRIIN